MMALALVAQPFYGLVSDQVAQALVAGQIIDEGFDLCPDKVLPTDDWSFSGADCYQSEHHGAAKGSLRFNKDGDSATLTLPLQANQKPDQLSFWLWTDASANKQSSLEVAQFNGATALGSSKMYSASADGISLDSSATEVVFILQKTGGNVALDDVLVTAKTVNPAITNVDASLYSAANYKGINVDTTFQDLDAVSSYSVTIHRADGSDAVIKATSATLALINDSGATSLTTPVMIQDGIDTAAVESQWWTQSSGAWTAATDPQTATVTIVNNGTTLSETVPVTTGSASYSDLIPKDTTAPDSSNDLPQLVRGNVTVHQAIVDDTAAASGKLRIWKQASDGSLDDTKFYASAQLPADQNGVVTYAFDSLKDLYGDGTYFAKFTSWDAAGNGSVQAATFTVDNTAPSLEITNPAANTYKTGTMTVSGTVSDNLSGVAGQTVTLHLRKVKDNGKLDGFLNTFTATVSPTGAWSTALNTKSFAGGVYGITGFVNDKAGNGQSASGGVSVKPFVIDNAGPAARFTTTPPQFVNGNFHVEGVASDNVSLKGVLFDVRDNNGWAAGCVGAPNLVYNADRTSATIACDINTANLVDGMTYTLRIHAGDNVGYGGGEERQVTVDRTAPQASIIVDPLHNNAYVTKTVKITGNVAASEKNMQSHWFEITGPNGYTYHAYDMNNGTNSWSFDWNTSKLVQGVYTIRYVATDKAGNRSDDPNHSNPTTIQVIVDNAGPSVEFTQAIDDNATLNGGFHVEATASDNVRLNSVGFDVRDPHDTTGNAWRTGCVAGTFQINYDADHKNAKLSCDIDTSKLVDGSAYYVRVHAGDMAGYGSKDAAPLSVRNFTVDRTAPNVPVLVTPVDGSVTKDNALMFSWNGSSDTYRYQIQVGTSDDTRDVDGAFRTADLVEQTNPAMTNYTFKTPLKDGTYYWHVRARDDAGNWSAYSLVRSLTIDTTGPVVSIISPADNQAVNSLGGLTVSGKIDLPDISGVDRVVVYAKDLTIGTQGKTVQATIASDGTWTATLDPSMLPNGDQVRIVAYAKDGLKNTGVTTHVDVMVDNTPTVTGSYFAAEDGQLNVGFNVGNLLGNAKSVTVALYDADKNLLTQNVGNSEQMRNLLNSNPADGISSPFYLPAQGSGDDWWTFGNPDWKNIATPAFAKVFVDYGGSEPATNEGFISLTSSRGYTYDGLLAVAYPQAPSTPGRGGSNAPANGTLNDVVPLNRSAATVATFGVVPTGQTTQMTQPGDDTAVLGASTTKDDAKTDDGAVKGTSTTAAAATQKPVAKLLGLAWYWWLLIVALIASLVYVLAGRRNQDA